MLNDLVMVTEPKPPGSRQLISPLAAVLEIAPAYVLHGAVGLQGLASSPTPETQVRVACAIAASGVSASKATLANPNNAATVFMVDSPPGTSLVLAHLTVARDGRRSARSIKATMRKH